MHRLVVLMIASLVLLAPVMQAAGAAERGGSDFVFFSLDGCARSDWVSRQYLAHSALIDRQLAAMYGAGQRRLRIFLPLNANNRVQGNAGLTPDYGLDIQSFLAAIRKAGFVEVLVVLSDTRPPPWRWTQWDEGAYRMRWAELVAVRAMLVASGLHYRLDLSNEGTPAPNQPMLLRYTSRLWADYTKAFGVADTLGFSIITTVAQDRFAQIPALYGNKPPPVFDVHIYGDAYTTFINAHRRMVQLGYGTTPWIIGESFYNDPIEAADLRRAIAATGQRVLFLLQWPLTSARRCKDVDVATTERFEAYAQAGF